MFDRFIRLARARKALQEGRYEEAIQLSEDPLLRNERRAEGVRKEATDRLYRRGIERLAAAEHSGAVRDLERVVAAANTPDAEARLTEARRGAAQAVEQRSAAQRTLDGARRSAEAGELAAAESAVRALAGLAELSPALQALTTFVAARRQRAATCLATAQAALRAQKLDEATEAFRAARTLDNALGAAPVAGELLGIVAAALLDEVGTCIDRADAVGASNCYRARVLALPELAAVPRVDEVGRRVAAALLQQLRTAPHVEGEAELLQAALAEPLLPGDGQTLRTVALLLQRLPALRRSGRSTELAAALAEAAERLGSPLLARQRDDALATARSGEQQVAEARRLAAAGDLFAARAMLAGLLTAVPMHELARAELDAVDQGLRERHDRLQTARAAAKAGRLREAYGIALASTVPGAAGEDAQILARDLRARMDVVGRGLDEVRVALHGQPSSSCDGLRHCLSRLEELAKVQSDHEDLPGLRSALQIELRAMERCEAAQASVARRSYAEAASIVADVLAQRGDFLVPDRLDARLLLIADRLGVVAEEALASGRLGELDQCLRGLGALAALRPDIATRGEQLRQAAAANRQRAEALVVEARESLAARDLSLTEQRCEAARQLWLDGPARKLEDDVRALREQEAALARVASLTADGDFAGAHQKLGDLPPTPAMLRTRIFDMKQSLAKAQGLDGAFLLRVDEGGEHLVLRGETIVVGNVRDGRADLPVLAAIAGRHARIQRSMSFHGGMQDSIVPEAGEVRVGAGRVQSHRLRSGDRVHLGSSLQLQYSVPSSRSLTAGLQLHGGFQVAGTDRVLLLKDRGRDGRILIGPGPDVHVRVAAATAEIEVFANKTGQIRVRCERGGSIDGRPFKDEHPVDAGALVQAAGVTFVMLPWARAR